MATAIASAAVAALLSCRATAGEFAIYDFFSLYHQRIDGVTPGAGDAREVNAATHVIDPWPAWAGRRRIPASGERMVGAVERYRDVRKLPTAPPALTPTAIGVGTSTSAATGGSTAR